MRQLTLIRDGKKVAEYLLDRRDVIIGRGRTAHIRLDENPVVSRQHLVIHEQGQLHVVEDLGGANGTFVNDKQVGKHTLRPGDRIVLGRDTLRYDFGHRGALSLRSVSQEDLGADDLSFETDSFVEPVPELSVSDVSVFQTSDSLQDLAKRNTPVVPRGHGGLGDGQMTAVADKAELEMLLAQLTVARKPHLRVFLEGGDVTNLDAGDVVELGESPALIGHTDACTVRLPGRKWFGRIAGRLSNEAGRWHIAPESTFWNPIWMGEDEYRLEKIRMLEDREMFEVGGLRFVYRKGEER